MRTDGSLPRRAGWTLLTAACLTAGCESVVAVMAPVGEIEVSPPSATVEVNGTTRLTASLKTSGGAALSGVEVAWRSLDPAIAEVDAAGQVRGLAPGTARIEASAQGVAAQASVTVTAPRPTLVVSPTSVSFEAEQGGSSPSSRTVQVSASGAGQLTGLTVQVSYASGQPTGWLSASLASTTGPTTLTLRPTTGSLVAGSYAATVRLNSPTATNGSVDVAVTFMVTPPPTPPAVPTEVTASASAGQAITVTWVPPGGQMWYHVRMRRGTSGSWDDPVTVPGDAISHTFTGLQRNRTYQFQVSACNPIGCSSYSSPVTAST